MKINEFGGPKPVRIDLKDVKTLGKFSKIAVKTSKSNKDDQKYAPRASRRRILRPKRRMVHIDAATTGVILEALGPPKVT